MPTEYTTRVYKYGAVPLEQFPKEGIDELFRENSLWNNLVAIHNENAKLYEEARRKKEASLMLSSWRYVKSAFVSLVLVFSFAGGCAYNAKDMKALGVTDSAQMKGSPQVASACLAEVWEERALTLGRIKISPEGDSAEYYVPTLFVVIFRDTGNGGSSADFHISNQILDSKSFVRRLMKRAHHCLVAEPPKESPAGMNTKGGME